MGDDTMTEAQAFKAMQAARAKLERAKRRRERILAKALSKTDGIIEEATREMAAAKERWESFE